MTIGHRIRSARERKGITQSALARSVGVRPQSVQQWESGETQPRPNRIRLLAEALGVQYVWLQTGEGAQERAVEVATILEPDDLQDPKVRRAIVDLIEEAKRTKAPPEKVEAAIKLVLMLLK